MNTKTEKNAFTLLELLVVIAIIGLLAGLLFPAINAALNTAKKAKAKAMCQSIEAAVLGYYQEYNRLPVANPSPNDNEVGNGNEGFSQDVMKVLMAMDKAPNNNHKLNHKRIVFLETSERSLDGEIFDPWGEKYQVILDLNGDGRIRYLTVSNQEHRKIAVAVSSGKNREWGDNTAKDDDNKDNVASVDLPLLN